MSTAFELRAQESTLDKIVSLNNACDFDSELEQAANAITYKRSQIALVGGCRSASPYLRL